jgi:hypothetical protein
MTLVLGPRSLTSALALAVIASCGGGGGGSLDWRAPASRSAPLRPSGTFYREIGGRRYRVGIPEAWNQVAPLPVVMWFAGSDRAQGYYGFSLDHNTWNVSCAELGCVSLSFETSRSDDFWDIEESRDTGDDAFIDGALADIQANYPTSDVFVSGISSGGKYALWYALHHPFVEQVASYEGVIFQPDEPELDRQEVDLRQELADNPRKFRVLYVIGGESGRPVYEDSLRSVEILRSEGYPVVQIFTLRPDGTVDTEQDHDWHPPSEPRIYDFFLGNDLP